MGKHLILDLHADRTVTGTWEPGEVNPNPPPVVTPPPIVTPPPVVTPPPAPPPSSAGGDIDWTTFDLGSTFPNPVTDPGVSIQASGARGVAIKFRPHVNRGIVCLAGYGPGAQEPKEMFISREPNDFMTPPGNQPDFFYRRVGTDLMYQWISVDGPHLGNEALLIADYPYFLNVRPRSQQGEISFVLGVGTQ